MTSRPHTCDGHTVTTLDLASGNAVVWRELRTRARRNHTADRPTDRCSGTTALLAREHGPAYDPAHNPAGPDRTALAPAPEGLPAPTLREVVADMHQAVDRVLAVAADEQLGPGAVAGLVELLQALDRGQAAATLVAATIERERLADRTAGLNLASVLASQSPLPRPQRRRLLANSRALGQLPQLRSAVAGGEVPAAALTALTAEARPLDPVARDTYDRCFTDRDRLRRLGADELVDAARDAAARLAPGVADRDQLRPIEDRFLSLSPRLDGSLTGYFELDPESAATLLEAIESAAPPPSAGPRDVTSHAHDTAEVQPVVPDSWRRRSRGRQRADGLVRLAEDHLAGLRPPCSDSSRDRGARSPEEVSAPPAGDLAPADQSRRPCGCRTRRARPRLLVLTDIATLTGHDQLAGDSRLLWAAVGRAPALTPTMVRRLASDADLQLILHDDGLLLGISRPTATIPARVRAAVLARDQGCRFPGCDAPVRYLDLHHVIAREADGPTEVTNLVGLCRRHHTAVTLGRWRLTMTPDGVVTVQRGRRQVTSEPPHRRQLRPSPRPPP